MEDSNKSELDVSLAMQILQPSHFVHLRGYRQRNSPVDISDEELLTTWQKRELFKTNENLQERIIETFTAAQRTL